MLCFVSMAKRIPGIKIPIDRIKRHVKIVLLWVVAENWQSQGKAYILFVFCCWTNTKPLLVHLPWICLFSEFCREVTDIQIPHVAPVILPEMYKIFIHAEVQCIHGYHVMCLCIMMKKKLWWAVNTAYECSPYFSLFSYTLLSNVLIGVQHQNKITCCWHF